MLYILLALTAALFLLFFIVFRLNKASTLSGFLFLCFLVCAGGSYAFFVIDADISWLYYTLIVVAAGFILAAAFGIYVLIALLLWNAGLVRKRERKSLANSLTLLLALALTAFVVLSFFVKSSALPYWARSLWGAVVAVIIFYFLHILLFLTSCLLCTLARPPKRQNYIVVLGSGLVNGGVSPLLGGRIDKAIAFYHKQGKKRTPPKLVMSGGQGTDEPMPEAEAMKAYALEKGVPEKDILVERQSLNTAQNMQFSKKVMDTNAAGKRYCCIYSTSNYHLLRAGMYARKAGMRIDGIGARTALYYLPNALLREYVAYFKMRRKWLIPIAVLVFAGILFLKMFPQVYSGFRGLLLKHLRNLLA